MRIRDVSWSNYRRLPDGEIELRDHLVLVGPNDSGKSSILRAMNFCLGMAGAQLAAAIEPRDFSDATKPLRIEVTLGDLNSDEAAAFPDEID
jgi:putative ATP-dependent endonuclease of the OLD family